MNDESKPNVNPNCMALLIELIIIAFAITGCSSGGSSTTDVSTQDVGSWSVAAPIKTFIYPTIPFTTRSSNFPEPQLAGDTTGNAFAIWRQPDESYGLNIWTNHYVADTGWGSAELLEFIGNSMTLPPPQIAVDTIGNAIAVWDQGDGSYFSISSNNYTLGMGWGTTELAEFNEGTAFDSQVAVDAVGNAIAVWLQDYGDSTRSVWSNRYVPGIGWGDAELIETISESARNPHVAVNADGNAFAIWQQSHRLEDDSFQYNVWGNYYSVDTGWGTAELVESGAQDPRIDIDASGNAMAVWRQSGWSCWDTWMFGTVCGNQANIIVNQYVAGIGWGDAEPLFTASAEVNNARSPQIAIDATGNAIAIWSQQNGSDYDVMTSYYVKDVGWGTAVTIDRSGSDTLSPQVAFDHSGNAIAVWSDYCGVSQPSCIMANRFVVSMGWDVDKLVGGGGYSIDGTVPNGDVTPPQLVVGAAGNAIVVWGNYTGWDGDDYHYEIMANRYELYQ